MILFVTAVLLSLAAAAWVIQPIVARRAGTLGEVAPGALLDAEARKRQALASLKEVEYDYAAGKLDDADYRTMRDRLSAEAVRALHAVDGARAASSAAEAHVCGVSNPPGSRFCAGCGGALA